MTQTVGSPEGALPNPYADIIRRAAAGHPSSVPVATAAPPASAPAGAGALPLPAAQQTPTLADLIASRGQEQWKGPATAAGNIAGVADDLLRGWMAGKAIGEQRRQQQAVAQVQGSAQLWEQAAQNYQQAVAQAKAKGLNPASDPSLAPYANAANLAWSNYNKVRMQYAFGQGDQQQTGGKKKGASAGGGSKVERELKGVKTELGHIFGADNPEMFPRMVLQHLSQLSGTQAAALSPIASEQATSAATQADLQQRQLANQEADAKAIQQMQQIAAKYPPGTSPEGMSEADRGAYQRAASVYESMLTPQQQAQETTAQLDAYKLDIVQRMSSPDPKVRATVTDDQRKLVGAYVAPRLITKTITGEDGNEYSVVQNEDTGAVVSRTNLGPAKLSDEQQYQKEWLAANHLPPTPANLVAAGNAWQKSRAYNQAAGRVAASPGTVKFVNHDNGVYMVLYKPDGTVEKQVRLGAANSRPLAAAQNVQDYLATYGLADTPENRIKAAQAIEQGMRYAAEQGTEGVAPVAPTPAKPNRATAKRPPSVPSSWVLMAGKDAQGNPVQQWIAPDKVQAALKAGATKVGQ